MRKFTTFAGCLCFMIAGVMMAISTNNQANAAKAINAATLPQLYVMDRADLPLDLQLKPTGTISEVKDTLEEKSDTVIPMPKPTPKKKVYRHRKPSNVKPDTIMTQPKLDTLYVSNPIVIIHRCPVCHNDSIEHIDEHERGVE